MVGGVCGRVEGCALQGACMVGGVHGRWHAWQDGACMAGGMHGRGMHGKGHVWQGGHVWHTRPQQILRDTGGTHPTGMHSCFANFWQKNCVKGEKVW